MSLHPLARTLALAACLLLGMAEAQAQVTALPQAMILPYNTPANIMLSASEATPGHHDAFRYDIVTPPAHGTLGEIVNSAVLYTPAANYVGADSFSFTATTFLSGTSAPATIRITMQSPQAPVADDGSLAVPFNVPAHLLLVGRNPDPSASEKLFYELLSPPTHGSVVLSEATATYTPNPGYAGPDLFTFRVRQDTWGTSNAATVSITVADPTGPVAWPGSGYAPHGTATPIALVAQDSHPGGPFALTYALHTPPAHGSVVMSGSTAIYTPASGPSGDYWGWDQFAFTATSTNGTSTPATVRVLVGQPMVLGVVTGAMGDTGQTRCTDSTGATMACAALTSHPGQDGRFGRDAQAGAAAFSYAALDAAGNATTLGGHDCVADQVTGLIWAVATQNDTWANVTSAAASTSRCGIASGWRLPTRRELLSIVHHGAANPAVDAVAFPLTPSTPTGAPMPPQATLPAPGPSTLPTAAP